MVSDMPSRHGPSSKKRVRLSVGCTYLPVLELYKAIFGGCLSSVGKMRSKSTKPMYYWQLGNRFECARCLLALEPYLLERKAKATLALEYLSLRIL